MDTVKMPDIGAIIPSEKGRKIAYAIFALVSLIVGDSVVFAASAFGSVPPWLLAVSAVVVNTAPVFGGLAIANVGSTKEQVVSES